MSEATKKGHKGHVTQELLVEKSAHLFKKQGYQSTTMQDIAEQLNIKKGSIYYHINSKEDLLYKIGQHSMFLLLEGANKIYRKNLDPQEKLKLMIRYHLEMITENIELFTVSLREINKTNAKSFWQEIVDLRRQYENIIRQVVQEGIDAGVFKDHDAKLIMLNFLGTVNWLIRWYNPDSRQNLENIIEVWTDIFLNGITKPGRREGEAVE